MLKCQAVLFIKVVLINAQISCSADLLCVQIASDMEEARAELQQMKRQHARAEQTIRSLEEELVHHKSSRKRATDSGPTEDTKKELEK